MTRILVYIIRSLAFKAYFLTGEMIANAKSCTKQTQDNTRRLEWTCLRGNAVGLYPRDTCVPRLYRDTSLTGLPGLVAECGPNRVCTVGICSKHSYHIHAVLQRKVPHISHIVKLDAGVAPLTGQKRCLPSWSSHSSVWDNQCPWWQIIISARKQIGQLLEGEEWGKGWLHLVGDPRRSFWGAER